MGLVFSNQKYDNNNSDRMSDCIINLFSLKQLKRPSLRTNELTYRNVVFHIKKQWPLILSNGEREFVRDFCKKYSKLLVIFHIIETNMNLPLNQSYQQTKQQVEIIIKRECSLVEKTCISVYILDLLNIQKKNRNIKNIMVI